MVNFVDKHIKDNIVIRDWSTPRHSWSQSMSEKNAAKFYDVRTTADIQELELKEWQACLYKKIENSNEFWSGCVHNAIKNNMVDERESKMLSRRYPIGSYLLDSLKKSPDVMCCLIQYGLEATDSVV